MIQFESTNRVPRLNEGLKFSAVSSDVPTLPGIYEIHTLGGISLKVGIASNLRSRLKQHAKSRQSGLKLKPDGKWTNPADVISKGSILAKHLYFDNVISPDYDLQTQTGRSEFLENECRVFFEVTTSKELAREKEIPRERDGDYRYVGRVIVR